VNPDPVNQLSAALECTGKVIDAVGADQWKLPTPCTDWNVTELVAHLASGNARFEAALRHQDPADDRTVDADPVSTYKRSIPRLLDAFRAPGAMDEPVTVPFGTVPGAVAANLRLTEVLVHGWDLAQATDQPTSVFPEDLAQAALAFSQGALGAISPDRRLFAPPQPVADDAPTIDRLAACLGRPVPSSASPS
jgi:uncharacterized protein (TIGR03086 family)